MHNNINIRFAGESIVGMVRRNNEDNFLIAVPENRCTALALIADGVGGHRHGEIVSHICCRDMGKAFLAADDAVLSAPGGGIAFMKDIVQKINTAVFEINFTEHNLHPMSSTLTAVLFTPGKAVMAHVGDSRLYRIAGEQVEQLSTDHTLFNDGEYSHLSRRVRFWARHCLSRSMGTKRHVKMEFREFSINPGDRFFLCTDGVYHDLDEHTLNDLLRTSSCPADTVNRIMRNVLLEGAHDNTTVISCFTKE